jgi:hypothetical protein
VIWRPRPPAPLVEVEPAAPAFTDEQVAQAVADVDTVLRTHTARPRQLWSWRLIDSCLEDRAYLARYGRRRAGAL